MTKAGNTRKADITMGQCKIRNKKQNPECKDTEIYKKRMRSKSTSGSKGVGRPGSTVGHHSNFYAKVQKDISTKRAE